MEEECLEGDPEFCFTAYPPLSSVAYPGKAIGLHAARALEGLLQGKSRLESIRVPITTVVERGSSAFLPAHDPVVAKILQHIRDLLATTDLALAEISSTMGFGSPQDTSRFFLRETGLTPSEFRTRSRNRPV